MFFEALRFAARGPSAERKEAFVLLTRHLRRSACYAPSATYRAIFSRPWRDWSMGGVRAGQCAKILNHELKEECAAPLGLASLFTVHPPFSASHALAFRMG
jgi:hypothetical protein